MCGCQIIKFFANKKRRGAEPTEAEPGLEMSTPGGAPAGGVEVQFNPM